MIFSQSAQNKVLNAHGVDAAMSFYAKPAT
jgi:hypothetical protein